LTAKRNCLPDGGSFFFTGEVMNEGSDYQRSIAFMCRDFLEQVEDIRELVQENDLLDRITSVIIEEGDEDLFHIRNLEAHLFKYESKLLSIYSKNPDNPRLDKLYRRSASLREMCAGMMRRIVDDGPGGAGNH